MLIAIFLNATQNNILQYSIDYTCMNLELSYPCVMGICNVTPDSFYDGGHYVQEKQALHHIERMIQQGAAIIDIGAYSARPGSADITIDQEYERLLPIVRNTKKYFSHIPISIDTFRSKIVERLYLEVGDIVVNDISGGTLDSNMMSVCGKYSLPYICMHMKGTPQTMQQYTEYTDVVQDIYSFFETQIQQAKQYGIETIIIDPGFGFAKTLNQNYEIIQQLQVFSNLRVPILVGFSRKSMIYKLCDTTPQEALNGTTVLNTLALTKGASILRVHDVLQAVEVITIWKQTNNV